MADVTAATLNVLMKLKADEFRNEVDQVSGTFDKLQQGVQKNQGALLGIGAALAGVGTVITGAFGLAIKAASDAEEVTSKFHAVFKGEAEATIKWVDEYSMAVGRSRVDILKWTSTLQDTFVPMGYSRKEAAEMSKSVTQLAVDLSSFNNIAEDDALNSLQSALVGNHETMRKFGVIITETTLGQELLNMGIKGGMKAATEAEKVQARLNIIFQGTADAQGDAIRTADGLANSTRGFASLMSQIGVDIGNTFVPTMQSVLGLLKGFASKFIQFGHDHPEFLKALVGITAAFGTLAATIGLLMVGSVGLVALISAFQMLGLSLSVAGPIGLAIAAFAITVGLIATHWKEVSAVMDYAWRNVIGPVTLGIQDGFKIIKELITGITVDGWNLFVNFYKDLYGIFSPVVDFYISGWNMILDNIKSIFGLPNGYAWQFIFTMLNAVYSKFRWVLDKLGIELPEIGDLFDDIKFIGTSAADAVSGKWTEYKTNFKKDMDDTKQKHATTSDAVKTKAGATTDEIISSNKEKNKFAQAFESEQFGKFVQNMLADEKEKKDKAYSDDYDKKIADQEKYEKEFSLFVTGILADEEEKKDDAREKEYQAWKEAHKSLQTIWNETIDGMGEYLEISVKSGGALFGGLSAFKNTLGNILTNVAEDFAGAMGTKLSTKVAGVFEGMGGLFSSFIGNVTSMGVQAVAGVIINKVITGVTPDYEKARTGREWQKAFYEGEKIFTVSGARSRLSESEFAWSEELLASLLYDINEYKRKESIGWKFSIFDEMKQKGRIEAFNVSKLNALAGFGLQELEKAVSDDPTWIASHWGTSGFTARMLADFGAKYSSQAAGLPTLASGGYIDSAGVIFAHAGEGVLNKRAIDSIGGQSGLNRINSGGSSGDIFVNITGNNINSELDLRSLARAAADEILKKVKLQERLSYQW